MTGLLSSLQQQVDADHAALLIIDIQNDFCAEKGFLSVKRGYDVSSCAEVARNIARLAEVARERGMPVIWIRSVYDFKYLAEPHRVKRVEEGCCMEGSWGADFFAIAPQGDDEVVTKHHFSGFFGTDLDQRLKSLGTRTLIVTGVATNVCVDSTLREGFFRGYHIVVAEDCVSSNSKAGHDGTLATVRNNIGIVASSAEIASCLQ